MSQKQKKERKPLSIPVYIAVFVAVIIACITIDQLSKYLVDKATFIRLDANGNAIRKDIPILGNWLVLHWTTNTGATGSMFSNLSWRNWLFFTMTLVGLPVFGWLLWRSRTRSVWGQVAYSFIIGGTIGNAIDRIWFAQDGFFTGSVRDFIRVEGFFGIFNGADSFLVVGVILALLAIIFFDSDSLLMSFLKERNAKTEQASSDTNAETAACEEAPQSEDQRIAEDLNTQHDGEAEHTDENG